MKKPYQINIDQKTKQNQYFREVLFTTDHAQLVVMNLKPGEEIGLEAHQLDQYLFFTQGSGETLLDGNSGTFNAGDVVVVPQGTEHNFTNTGSGEVKLFTVYAPSEHPDGTVHKTKAEADADEADHHS